MKTCRLCGAEINLAVDETVCGYDKCVKCCGGCMHRTHYNPKSPAGRSRLDFLANLQNKNVLDRFFSQIK